MDDNSATRQLQAVKMRGSDILPGLHTLRIDESGVRVFRRGYRPSAKRTRAVERFSRRLPTGVPGLDELLDGGVPNGDAGTP